ncbi:hypothetical protein HHL22_20765 [Hymenobacter sp. RP-2-7]|uniref:SseB family protein n=1 Tax=Hymenobacter polaris TaxID=2682546 RepID=A0A7Y0AHU8_9BACT|nr:hypothetical protein [Hymenobacter polaris]NML67641.1 hypothetical protein [Hymenobacter polaris]
MAETLLPPLRGALNPKESHNLQDGFKEADLLHLLQPLAGRPAGTVLPVLGQLACFDARGQLWRLLAYVPASPSECTTYAGRQARRFPEAGQVERWFAGIPLGYFTEIDLTDSAECLALERQTEAIVVPMYPANQQAQHLRKAA